MLDSLTLDFNVLNKMLILFNWEESFRDFLGNISINLSKYEVMVGVVVNVACLVASNILSALSALFLLISVRSKTKIGMMYWQSADASMALLSYLFLGGVSGVLANGIAILRNLLIAKKKNTLLISVVLIVITLALGIINGLLVERSWISLFPIIATSGYAAALLLIDDYKVAKTALSAHFILWALYGLSKQNFVSALLMIVLALNAIHSIFMLKGNPIG